MTNVDLIEKKDLREQMIGRVEVLDKVKVLFLIPEMNVMTVKQVAGYFEVPIKTLQTCYRDNKTEIDEDGVKLCPYKDFSSLGFQELNISKGKATYKISESITLEIPTRGIKVFSKRAILRFSMLLRDSTIAQEVRTQLLNTFEHSTVEQRITDIDDENQFANNIGLAFIGGNLQEFSIACAKYIDFKNRHITKLEEANAKLETVNELLTRKTMEWGDKAILNALVRTLAANCFHSDFRNAWNALYRSIKYKYSIDVHSRKGDGKLIDKIKEEEFSNVISMAVSLCESNKIDVAKAINEINETNIK